MDSMFRTLGKKVELIRYRVTYTEDEIQMTENCISDEHKNEIESNLTVRDIEFTTVAVDQTGNEWINGLEFDSYDEALIAFNNGEVPKTKEEELQEELDNAELAISELSLIIGGYDECLMKTVL